MKLSKTIGLPLKNTSADRKLFQQLNWLMKNRNHRTYTSIMRNVISETYYRDKTALKHANES
jgi:hypothetical protein